MAWISQHGMTLSDVEILCRFYHFRTIFPTKQHNNVILFP